MTATASDAPSAPRRRTPLALQHPAFRRLSGAWVFTNIADSALFLVIAVWVKELTGSDSAAAFVFVAFGLPSLFAPVLGDIADRTSRKWLLVVANFALAVVVASLLFIDSTQWLWLIYAVVFAYGVVGFLTVAAQAGLVRDLLPDEHLASGNGVLTTIDQTLRLIAPVAGTAAYAFVGPKPVVIVTIVAFLLASAVTATLRVTESPFESRDGVGYVKQVSAGFAHLWNTLPLRRAVVAIAIAFAATGLVNVAVFPVLEQGLGLDAAAIGPLVALQGAGAIVAGITAATLIGRSSEMHVLAWGLVALAAGIVPTLFNSIVAVAVGLILVGGGVTYAVVAYVTLRQRLTPPRLQGRTGAAANVTITVPQTLLMIVGATLVAIIDYRILIAMTVLGVLAGLAYLLLSLRNDRIEPTAP